MCCCRWAPTTRRRTSGSPRFTGTGTRAIRGPGSCAHCPRSSSRRCAANSPSAGIEASPQTRDMNPIYTGCHVSYIDTKQANRAAEDAVLDAEKFAVFAGLLGGATYPQAAFAKAWVQLAYGAHHDAITGSESDQVYLDLLTGWRDAWELGRTARDNALALLSRAVDGPVVVWNALAHKRTDVVTATLDEPVGAGVRVLDSDGTEVPAHVEHGGRLVSWLARDVPSLGWQSYRLAPADTADGWEPLGGEFRDRQHALPPSGGSGARWRGGLAGRGRVGSRVDRRREGRQRAGRLRRVPRPSAGRRGAVAPASEGAGRLLVGGSGAGAGLPRTAG